MNHEIIGATVLYGGSVVTGLFFASLPFLLNKLK